MDKLPQHLGGGERRCHHDMGALKWAVANWHVKSMIDVGCGRGCVVQDAISLGLDAMGVDGDPGNLHGEFNYERPADMPFLLHDYTNGPADIDRTFDLCWSVEFLEHVDAEYIPHFMNTFQKCKYIVTTAAKPGDGGRHHVNEQPPEYWIEVFDQYGFDYDSKALQLIQEASTMTKKFINRNGLVFVNREMLIV